MRVERKATARSLRAAGAGALMTPRVVRLVEPLTRRRIRHLGVEVRLDPALVSAYTRAEVFWGLYERTECAYIQRYLSGSRYVIELGAGIGVSSAHIAAALDPGGTMVCVEANRVLLPAIERNIAPALRRSRSSGTVIHAAVGDDEGPSILTVEGNPFAARTSHDLDAHVPGAVRVATRSLQSIVDEHRPESFDLVCDVEGAEVELIASAGTSGLERCRRLIVELHRCTVGGRSFEPDDLLAMLSGRWGFLVLARKGPVVAMTRT